ncbi:MAG: ribonuclease D [Spirochaetales bacterium]|uniref:Ribonuclease D n=1 Tax=Candidatus Thalassospirochaeta sargassi TaxID=3119039 RepID=A0AAJ1IJ17_9SPIO|nr:ribonuclease D [Spirochaetales bacterium]
MEFKILESTQEIYSFIERLKSENLTTIAMDFEGEFNLHVYGEKLCLIQIFDGCEAYIIDPLKADMSAVKKLFEDEKILKIMWDAQSDISLVVNGYSMTIKSVLDLRPAADLLELTKKDYASVTAEILEIEKKAGKSRFQKYNWMRRPIDKAAVEYALNDVLHLHALRDEVFKRLYDKNLINEFFRLNMIVQNRNYVRVPGQRHKKMKGYRYLSSNEKKKLKKIFDIRDSFARELNWPPHRVIANPELIEISKGITDPGNIRFDRKITPAVRQEIILKIRNSS